MPDENMFALPDPLPTGAEELTELEGRAVKAFEDRHAQGVATPEDLTELQALAEAVRTVRAAVEGAAETGQEEEGPEEGAEEAEETEEAAPEAEPAEAEAPRPNPSQATLDAMLLAQPAAQAAAEAPAQAQAQASAPAPAPVSVAAAAAPSPDDFQMPIAAPSPVVILASADIPGIPMASALDGMDGLVAAVGAKARSVPNMAGSQHPVASLQKPLSSDRNLDGLSERDAIAKMNDLSSPEFLLASGGWCAPSEIIYDFACEVEAAPEMVDLPTFSTSRGGVRFPVSPTFRDFMALENNGLFTWTEEDDVAAGTESPPGPTKPCFHIPCVTFDEARLELEGICATAGNLTDRAYPELIRRYLSLLLNGHLHRMNTQKIAKMLALVDDTVAMPASFAAASAVLDALLLQVQDLRDQFSMGENSVVEGMAPRWLRPLIRSDVARREQTDLSTVSNADIRSYLLDAGVSFQFVSDWQTLGDPLNPATAWPATADVLVWLPGAYRELTGPSLDIAVARDSVLNSTNDFTVAFTEESYQVYKPGCGSRLVEIPVCPNGASGERVALVCAAES